MRPTAEGADCAEEDVGAAASITATSARERPILFMPMVSRFFYAGGSLWLSVLMGLGVRVQGVGAQGLWLRALGLPRTPHSGARPARQSKSMFVTSHPVERNDVHNLAITTLTADVRVEPPDRRVTRRPNPADARSADTRSGAQRSGGRFRGDPEPAGPARDAGRVVDPARDAQWIRSNDEDADDQFGWTGGVRRSTRRMPRKTRDAGPGCAV